MDTSDLQYRQDEVCRNLHLQNQIQGLLKPLLSCLKKSD